MPFDAARDGVNHHRPAGQTTSGNRYEFCDPPNDLDGIVTSSYWGSHEMYFHKGVFLIR
jgi:hypothetical protein